MEMLQCNALGTLSSSFSLTRAPASSSFTPISSAALLHKASSDRPLQSCTFASPTTKDPHAENPISASTRSLTFHSCNHALKDAYAENRSPSSSSAKFQKKTLIVMRNNAAAGYAAALAQMGQSKHILNLIYADLKKLGTFLQHKQFHSFLLHPSIHDTHKKNILTRLAEDHAFVPYTLKLLNLIVDKKRASLLKDVVKEFEVIYDKIAETEVSIVLSATEMDAAQLAHIAKRMQGMSASKNVLDASLVAGYIVKYGKDGSHLIDMTVNA